MRSALILLLALHGAIHGMGFLKWSRLAAVPALSGRTWWTLSPTASQVFALLWLATLFCFGGAAIRLARDESWWLPGLIGVLLSQSLIIVAWHDAKFGTMANLLLLLLIIAGAAHSRFEHSVDDEVRTLLARLPSSPAAIVRRDDLLPLPPPVRNWLEASGVVGKARTRVVFLKQRGALRTSPEAEWMPATAEQTFTVEEPAFLWKVDAKMFGVPIAGRDKYANGAGHMLIKAASLANIVDASDEKIAHGALLRFLGEIVWFPSAALEPYVAWEAVDATHAKATLRHAGLTASAVFEFDAAGRARGMRAERYLGGGDEAVLHWWSVICSEWGERSGFRVPVLGDVIWNLPEGDFNYFRWQLLDVEYDQPRR